MTRLKYQGSLALVTGAASGIGRATALELAKRGARVLCVDIDESGAEKTAAACAEAGAPEAFAYRVDVADADAMAGLADRVHREHGVLDILVNNAGVGMSGSFDAMSLEDWRWIRSINLDGVVHGCRVFGPEMTARGRGHVVNVSSGLAYTPRATEAAYVATKAGVLALSRSLRADWGPRGVGVSAVCPGIINTPIIEATRFVGDDPDAATHARGLFRRGHAPQKVAKAIVRAIDKDKAVARVGLEARAGWLLHRFGPMRLQERVARQSIAGLVRAPAKAALQLEDGERFSVTTDDGAVLAGRVLGDGPLVVLTHGWTWTSDLWAPVATRLVRGGHRVVAYDHRGHGASTCGTDGFSLPRLARDLRAVLEHVDARDAVLAGHSIGGMAIQALLSEHPDVVNERVKSVVLVATSARGVRSARLGVIASRVVGSALATGFMRTPLGLRAARGAFGRDADRALVALTRDMFTSCAVDGRGRLLGVMQKMDLRALRDVAVPVTVMIGGRDRLTAPKSGREIAARLGADVVELPRAGHMVPLEAPDQVVEVVKRSARSRSRVGVS